MIKYYPFYDYYKKPRDGSNFENAIYYSTASTDNGYINKNNLQNQNLSYYFLVDCQRGQQYFLDIQKFCYDWSQYRFEFEIYDLEKNQLFFYQQEYNDYYYSTQQKFYLTITNTNIQVYTKNQLEKQTISSANVQLNNQMKFYFVIYPNITSFNISPKPKIFQDTTKNYHADNDYNRQANIFVKKMSDTYSLGLNEKGNFPKNNLVFYFDFEEYNYEKNNYTQNAFYKSKYGDYTLNIVQDFDWYSTKGYLSNSTDGINGKNCCSTLNSLAIQAPISNFAIDKNFQQFTLMGWIKKSAQYASVSTPNLFSVGFNGEQNDEYELQDENNRNKGFGFYLKNNCVGIRINDRKQLMNQISLQSDKWYYICVTYDKTYLRGYVNGVLQTQLKLQQFTLQQATKFYVGSTYDYNNNHYYNNFWNYLYGYKLDQIACFDKCLIQLYISTIYEGKMML